MYEHSWSYHQHIPDGWHGNVQTEIQSYRCRKCGTTKQMPAYADIKPPLAGCTLEAVAVVKIQEAKDPIEEKGDYDYEPVRAGKGGKSKAHGR